MVSFSGAGKLLLAAGLGVAASAANAQGVEDFYKGRKIDIVIGFTVGGGYDAYARLVARHMGEHIPGKPGIVPRNMAGAGSRTAAAFIHGVAPKDGTAMGIADQSIPLEQALGDVGVKFDSREFNWIGNPNADNNVLTTWHTSPVKTIDDARKFDVTVGATGFNTSSQYHPRLSRRQRHQSRHGARRGRGARLEFVGRLEGDAAGLVARRQDQHPRADRPAELLALVERDKK
jgi:tripartite-type tricarboxylate transporter receptor subunit TctC